MGMARDEAINDRLAFQQLTRADSRGGANTTDKVHGIRASYGVLRSELFFIRVTNSRLNKITRTNIYKFVYIYMHNRIFRYRLDMRSAKYMERNVYTPWQEKGRKSEETSLIKR